MSNKLQTFTQQYVRRDIPDIRPGDIVKIHQRIPDVISKGKKETGKAKIQAFEGVVIARKHGKGVSATVTVRRVVSGLGVEKIFPLYSPTIEKIEILRRANVRRAKLYYLRDAKGKRARLKYKEFTPVVWEAPKEEPEKKEEPKEEKEKSKEEKPAKAKEEKAQEHKTEKPKK